ncbi:hypothetical protein ACFFUP_18630 [Vibrio ostreicida]|uniref:Uncharacterized protein n=1 Tax=Vibrio ostreicida TaxID=526588 RepID=A0ABT8BR73_9VIBR|nr:hypothetical protein [Vibrio ostreicida]MDN3608849.1 hypothetical protein [Vibrio ostreicida]NPD09883.1 hypothetical protein [Vibrio ostreicida]
MIDKEVITIEKELYNSDFEFYDSRALRVDWINKNNYQVFIFLGGTEVLFEPIFSNLNSFFNEIYLCKEPSLKERVDRRFIIDFKFSNNLDYYESLVNLDGLFFKNHLIFSKNLELIMQVVDEDVLIVAGKEETISNIFNVTLISNKYNLYKELDEFGDYPYAKYYWGDDWYK